MQSQIAQMKIIGLVFVAKYHFFQLKQKKMIRLKLIAYFLNLPCPKRERYYICRLKVLGFGEVASRHKVGIRASRLKIGKVAWAFER